MSNSLYPVYIGLWTNWSYGPVLGKTLTVTRADGALIIAFVAFFVTTIGSAIWRIICFCLHNFYSTPQAQDALHNQKQVVLRNSKSPVSGFWELVQLLLAWRKLRSRSLSRLLPVIIFAGLVATLLIVASGFSSRVSLGNEVLIAADDCGILNINNATTDEYYRQVKPYFTRISEISSDYSERCYKNSSGMSGCNTLVRASLPTTIDLQAKCPFDSSLCLSQSNNIFLDTGLLDSHYDFGINHPPSSRFKFRQTLTCAPLVTEGHKANFTDKMNRTLTSYLYGRTATPGDSECNCTCAFANDILKPSNKKLMESIGIGYKLSGIYALFMNGSLKEDESAFIPIPEFNRTDAELFLIFLSSNTITFLEESSDLWYRATTPLQVTLSESSNNEPTVKTTFWETDEPAWPMGCITQFQVCVQSSTKGHLCTDLAGLYDIMAQVGVRFEDPGGLITWFLTGSAQATNFMDVVDILGAKSLTSRLSLIADDVQGTLEPNQWQLDVISWFYIMQASRQLELVNIAAGPARANPTLSKFLIKPDGKEQKHMCENQVIHSTEYMSFSVFGLLFIFTTGIFLIVLSLILEPFTHCIQQRFKRNPYARVEWQATNKLHLQRLAHEEIGFGNWTNGFQNTPVTLPGEKLAILDISDVQAMRLVDPAHSVDSRDLQPHSSDTNTEHEQKRYPDDTIKTISEAGNSNKSGSSPDNAKPDDSDEVFIHLHPCKTGASSNDPMEGTDHIYK